MYRACLVLLMLPALLPAASPFTVDGNDVRIVTDRYEMVLRDGVFVYLRNTLTGETYADDRQAGWSPNLVRGVTSPVPDQAAFDSLHLVYGGTGIGHANWGNEATAGLPALCYPGAAAEVTVTRPDDQSLTITYAGLNRAEGGAPNVSLSYRLRVDPATGDLLVQPQATSTELPLGGAAVALSGLDPAGTVLLPHQSGHAFNVAVWGERLVSPVWPRFWTFGMAVVDFPRGSFMIYADDPKLIHKRIFCSLRTERTDLSVLSYNPLPYADKREVPGLVWRLNVYPGNWVAPARTYAKWSARTHDYRPLDEQRPAWLKQVRTLYSGSPSLDQLHRLADQLTPEERQTVLFGMWQSWLHPTTNTERPAEGHGRWLPYNPDWGKYRGRDDFKEFVDEAHRLGFKILVFVNLMTLNWDHPLLWEAPITLQSGVLTPADREHVLATRKERRGLAYVHQADQRWQEFSIRTLKQLVADYEVDAVYLDCASVTVNGVLCRGMTPAAGAQDWHRAVRAALPDLALLGEQVHEATVNGEAFALESVSSWGNRDEVPRLLATIHPLGGAIMSDYCNRFGWRGRGADFGKWQDASEASCHVPNTFVDRIAVYGRYGLRYTYPEVWEPDVRCYLSGNDGRTFRYVVDHGSRFEAVDAAGAREFFYWRLHGATTVPQAGHIADWYAWNVRNEPIGLDPEDYYFLKPGTPPVEPCRIGQVSDGLAFDELRVFPEFVAIRPRFAAGADGGSFTCDWADAVAVAGSGAVLPVEQGRVTVPGDVESLVLCRRLPPPSTAPVAILDQPLVHEFLNHDRLIDLPAEQEARYTPVPRNGRDGVARQMRAEPWYEGEHRVHFLVRVPDVPAPELRAKYALPILGRLTQYADGVTFRLRLNGREVLNETLENSPDWHSFSTPLAAYRGKPLLITLVTEAGPLHQCDQSDWGDIVIDQAPQP